MTTVHPQNPISLIVFVEAPISQLLNIFYDMVRQGTYVSQDRDTQGDSLTETASMQCAVYYLH